MVPNSVGDILNNFSSADSMSLELGSILMAALASNASVRLQASVIRTGRPCAKASSTTIGKPSLKDGSIKASAFW